jgi:hypothetical protein
LMSAAFGIQNMALLGMARLPSKDEVGNICFLTVSRTGVAFVYHITAT